MQHGGRSYTGDRKHNQKEREKIQSSGWEIQTKAQADNDEQVLLFL